MRAQTGAVRAQWKEVSYRAVGPLPKGMAGGERWQLAYPVNVVGILWGEA